MSLIVLAGVWAVLVCGVSMALRAPLRTGKVSELGGAATLAAVIATFPFGLALTGVGGISWSTAVIAAVILGIPSLVAALLVIRAIHRRPR